MPDDQEVRGISVVEGSISVAGREYGASRMVVSRPGDRITVAASAHGARLLILGGMTLAGPRSIWWNFVASSKERIEAAETEWRQKWDARRLDLPADDRQERIPSRPTEPTYPDALRSSKHPV